MQEANRFFSCAAQVPSRLISVARFSEPFAERVPPLILRAITSGRRLRSARLFVAGTRGSATMLLRSNSEDEEFMPIPVDARRQDSLRCTRPLSIGPRQLRQLALETRLRLTPRLGPRISEGRSAGIYRRDRIGPGDHRRLLRMLFFERVQIAQ